MPATKTPSMHHVRRWNMTTSMVGLEKNGHIRKKSHQKMVNPRDMTGNAEDEEEEEDNDVFCIYMI